MASHSRRGTWRTNVELQDILDWLRGAKLKQENRGGDHPGALESARHLSGSPAGAAAGAPLLFSRGRADSSPSPAACTIPSVSGLYNTQARASNRRHYE